MVHSKLWTETLIDQDEQATDEAVAWCLGTVLTMQEGQANGKN
jgi:hypothetical protein